MQGGFGKNLWLLFFGVTCAVSLWFLALFSIKMYPYIMLSQVTNARVSEFHAKPLSENKYAVEAKFSFKAAGKDYEESYTFVKPIFLNKFAAENHVKNFWKEQSDWLVYYKKGNPSYCSLQKIFPFKYLFNFGITFCIMFYFMWLRNYVARMS
ncbi:MAG: hypothetical protein S4CHLAM37_00550 [Chlamydiia bacterium]|nr:hypothetical protein [Chlamydiia bacterium]